MTEKRFEKITAEMVRAKVESLREKAEDAYGLIGVLADECLGGDTSKATKIVEATMRGIDDFEKSYTMVEQSNDISVLEKIITKSVCAKEPHERMGELAKLAKAIKIGGEFEEAEAKQLEELIERLEKAAEDKENPVSLTDEEVAAWADEFVHIAHLASAGEVIKGFMAEDCENAEDTEEHELTSEENAILFRAAAIYQMVKNGEIEVGIESDEALDEEALAYQIGVSTASRVYSEESVRNGKAVKTLKVVATVALIVGACGIIAASGSWVFAAIAAKQIMETKAAVMVASLAAGVVGWLMFGTLEDYKDRHRGIENYVIDVKDTAMEAKEAAKKAAEAAKATYEEVKPRAKAAMNIMGDFLKAKGEKIKEKLDERIKADEQKKVIDVEVEEEIRTVKA